MRRFTVTAIGCAGEDLFAWEDVGFKPVENCSGTNRDNCPDVVLLRVIQDQQTEWKAVESLLPKVYVVLARSELLPPVTLSDIYEHQLITAKDICFNIGSSLQGKVAVPDWEAFSRGGLLTGNERIKAVAGSVYRFLLEDVFRETAEWCGHMSSVVGPL